MLKKLINFLKKLFRIKSNDVPAKNTNKGASAPEKQYEKKKLLTQTELKFYYAIKKYVPEEYTLLPQINLASIINRVDDHKYQNELYRNIDFAIFNKSWEPIAAIEINDKTHNDKSRIARDHKVKEICESAALPLITFWTDYGVNEEYIQKRISEYVK